MKNRLVNLTDSTCPESAPGSYLVVHQPDALLQQKK